MKEVLFDELEKGRIYAFLWGPTNLRLSGVLIIKKDNGLAYFKNARTEHGELILCSDDEVASYGPFFQITNES